MCKCDNAPLSYRFHEVYKLFIRAAKKECDKLGINPTYRFIFMALKSSKEGLTQSEICKVVHLKAPSVSLLLHQMENEGLIVRNKSNFDSRKIVVTLTEKGKQLDESVIRIFQKTEISMNNCLSKEEFDNLISSLNKISLVLLGGEEDV